MGNQNSKKTDANPQENEEDDIANMKFENVNSTIK